MILCRHELAFVIESHSLQFLRHRSLLVHSLRFGLPALLPTAQIAGSGNSAILRNIAENLASVEGQDRSVANSTLADDFRSLASILSAISRAAES